MVWVRMTPARRLVAVAFACLLGALAAVILAIDMPALGMRLAPDASGKTVVLLGAPADGAHEPPPGAQLVRIEGANGHALDLEAGDLVEEPDFIDEYSDMNRFFERQGQLATILRGPVVRLHWAHGDGSGVIDAIASARPISALPMMFWWQLAVGAICCLIGAWVSALRPADAGARMLALTGMFFPLATFPAAIYSSRELALDHDVIRTLSSINHVGTLGFGAALVGLFLCYPRKLVADRTLWLIAGATALWILADRMQWVPNQDWGVRVPTMVEMLGAIGGGLVQWRLSGHEPARRAALRWLLIAALVGSGLFVFTLVGSQLLGAFAPTSQGLAFGYFLIMFVGMALGVGRYRLFELDRWAYRILLWLLGGLSVVLIDLFIVWTLHSDPLWSLSGALLVAGWLYFPLRQWLWRRAANGPQQPPEAELPRIMDIAFTPQQADREAQWAALLHDHFRPMRMMATEPSGGMLADDGIAMMVPACGGLAARRLEYAEGGRRLFSPGDVHFMAAVCRLMDQAASSRSAFEQGTNQERRRIAHEMHDNLGARLLTALHSTDAERRDGLLRDTVRDLRSIVYGMTGADAQAGEVLADLRHETAERLETAGIGLTWAVATAVDELTLGARQVSHVKALVRETVSNAIRHAAATAIDISAQFNDGIVRVVIEDNGVGFDPASIVPGMGLAGQRARIAEMGGRIAWSAAAQGGTRVIIEWPVTAT